MKYHPVLFSASMLEAIRNGDKTQTRRVPGWQNCDLNGQGMSRTAFGWLDWDRCLFQKPPDGTITHRAAKAHGKLLVYNRETEAYDKIYPVWKPGDRLWVREPIYRGDDLGTYYKLDNQPVMIAGQGPILWPGSWNTTSRPSIHMPRSACRMILEVVEVRGEFLREIDADIYREGFRSMIDFIRLWDSLNTKRGWPWRLNRPVWVIEFKALEGTELQEALAGLRSGTERRES